MSSDSVLVKAEDDFTSTESELMATPDRHGSATGPWRAPSAPTGLR